MMVFKGQCMPFLFMKVLLDEASDSTHCAESIHPKFGTQAETGAYLLHSLLKEGAPFLFTFLTTRKTVLTLSNMKQQFAYTPQCDSMCHSLLPGRIYEQFRNCTLTVRVGRLIP